MSVEPLIIQTTCLSIDLVFVYCVSSAWLLPRMYQSAVQRNAVYKPAWFLLSQPSFNPNPNIN